MLKNKWPTKSRMKGVIVEEGESLMNKLRKMTTEQDVPEEVLPIIYTDKANGVLPAYNIRTDRFEIGREAMEKIKSTEKKKRSEQKAVTVKKDESEKQENPEQSPEANPSGIAE